MQVEILEAVPSDAPVLANLLSLYLHDFSEVLGGAPGADGRFEYARLPLYFEEPHRIPLLITANESLAGFALVSRGSYVGGSPDTWDLCELFVVRGFIHFGSVATDAPSVGDAS